MRRRTCRRTYYSFRTVRPDGFGWRGPRTSVEPYDTRRAFETPRAGRADIELLRGDDLRGYMTDVRERALEVPVADGMTHELVLHHDLQHTETMLQAMAPAGRLPGSWTPPQPVAGADEWISFTPGDAWLGAGREGFAAVPEPDGPRLVDAAGLALEGFFTDREARFPVSLCAPAWALRP